MNQLMDSDDMQSAINEMQVCIGDLQVRVQELEGEILLKNKLENRVARLERCELRRTERDNPPDATTGLVETNERNTT